MILKNIFQLLKNHYNFLNICRYKYLKTLKKIILNDNNIKKIDFLTQYI